MKQEKKLEAIKMCMNDVVTCEINPCINGTIRNDIMCIVDCATIVIDRLIKNGYSIAVSHGKTIVDYFE